MSLVATLKHAELAPREPIEWIMQMPAGNATGNANSPAEPTQVLQKKEESWSRLWLLFLLLLIPIVALLWWCCSRVEVPPAKTMAPVSNFSENPASWTSFMWKVLTLGIFVGVSSGALCGIRASHGADATH
jgi:hypothetical protein